MSTTKTTNRMSTTKTTNRMSTTKVITGKVRFSYCKVFKAEAMNEGDTPKYGVSILIDKKDTATLDKIKAAIQAALEQGKSSKFDGKIPKAFKNPLRDGDEERDSEEYEGCMFVNATSTRKPGLVDAERQEIIDPDELYSGCYGRASINFYPFNASGNKGVAAGLNNLQKLIDGPRLGAEIESAEDDFAESADDLM